MLDSGWLEAILMLFTIVLCAGLWWIVDRLFGDPWTRRRPIRPPNGFPHTVDLEGLRVHIHRIELPADSNERVACLAYVSEGLRDLGQRELVLTVASSAGRFPPDPVRFFRRTRRLAAKGRRVDAGCVTVLGSPDLLGFGGAIYAESPVPLPGPEGALATVPVTRDEAVVARTFGTTRVLSRLGARYRCHPFPVWADPGRAPVALPEAEGDSVLGTFPIVNTRRASFVFGDSRAALRISDAERDFLRFRLTELPVTRPFALTLAHDPDADAHLIWPGERGGRTRAGGPSGSRPSRSCCAFIGLFAAAEVATPRLVEDGIVIPLSIENWQRIREALRTGRSVEIAGGSGAGFSVEWVPDDYYCCGYRGAGGEPCTFLDPFEGNIYFGFTHRARTRGDRRPEFTLRDAAQIARNLAREDLAGFLSEVVDTVAAAARDTTLHGELMIRITLAPDAPPAFDLAAAESASEEDQAAVWFALGRVSPLRSRRDELLLHVKVFIRDGAVVGLTRNPAGGARDPP